MYILLVSKKDETKTKEKDITMMLSQSVLLAESDFLMQLSPAGSLNAHITQKNNHKCHNSEKLIKVKLDDFHALELNLHYSKTTCLLIAHQHRNTT